MYISVDRFYMYLVNHFQHGSPDHTKHFERPMLARLTPKCLLISVPPPWYCNTVNQLHYKQHRQYNIDPEPHLFNTVKDNTTNISYIPFLAFPTAKRVCVGVDHIYGMQQVIGCYHCVGMVMFPGGFLTLDKSIAWGQWVQKVKDMWVYIVCAHIMIYFVVRSLPVRRWNFMPPWTVKWHCPWSGGWIEALI